MPKKSPSPPTDRKPRADAVRNREHILQVAKEIFTRDGETASMDDIARQAEVGPGTLYRHFPNRDVLIEAVYRNEVERLAAAAERFAQEMQPLPALRAWMLLFIDHIEAKMLILPALNAFSGGTARLMEGTRPLIHAAFARAVQRAIGSGDLRPETNPDDFIRALVGVLHTTAVPGWESSARRLVDILIDGSRAVPKPISPTRRATARR